MAGMSGNSVTPPVPAPDWERIEVEFRAGVLSLREIAALHPGTNHVAISRRAKKGGWTRDLAAKIKAKAEELVTRQAVTPAETLERQATEREVIEANAARIAQVRGEHRKDINRVRALGLSLLAELEGQGANLEHLEHLGDLLRSEDKAGQDKANDLYRKIISTPGRIDGAKKVAETLKIAIGLEREAYNLDADPTGKDGATPGEAKILSDAERASRLAALLHRARARAEVGDDAAGS